jgi:hypothetical protein
MGIVNLAFNSAKVLPRQTLFPPINGVKAKGFRGFPSEFKIHLLSLFFVSKRSGIYKCGSGHYSGSW